MLADTAMTKILFPPLRIGLSLLLVVLAWQSIVVLRLVPPKYLPGMDLVWQGALDMARSGELADAAAITFIYALTGLAAASVIGIGLAILTDLSPTFRRGFRQVATFVQPIPPAALVPMAVFMLGLGLKLYLFVIIVAAVWPPYVNTVAALAGVSSEQIRSARMFQSSLLERLWLVKLPAAFPEIFAGIRYAATISLAAAVVANMIAGGDGLGYLLLRKAFSLHIPEVYALMFVCGLMGVALNVLVALVRWPLTDWHTRMMERAR